MACSVQVQLWVIYKSSPLTPTFDYIKKQHQDMVCCVMVNIKERVPFNGIAK